MKKTGTDIKFRTITASQGFGVWGLTNDGRVYKYISEDTNAGGGERRTYWSELSADYLDIVDMIPAERGG